MGCWLLRRLLVPFCGSAQCMVRKHDLRKVPPDSPVVWMRWQRRMHFGPPPRYVPPSPESGSTGVDCAFPNPSQPCCIPYTHSPSQGSTRGSLCLRCVSWRALRRTRDVACLGFSLRHEHSMRLCRRGYLSKLAMRIMHTSPVLCLKAAGGLICTLCQPNTLGQDKERQVCFFNHHLPHCCHRTASDCASVHHKFHRSLSPS